jgi:hypothetical protein
MESRWSVRFEAAFASCSYRDLCLGNAASVHAADLESSFRVQHRYCDLVRPNRHTDCKGLGLWNDHFGVAFCLEENHRSIFLADCWAEENYLKIF